MIKKLVSTIILMLLFAQTVHAEINWACTPEPTSAGKTTGSFFSTITGASFFARLTAESIIKNNLKKNTESDFDVDMKPFSAFSLASGRFKKLELYSPSVNMGGLFLNHFKAGTACDYNHIGFKKDAPPIIYNDFIMNFQASMNNDDLQKTLKTEAFQKYVKGSSVKIANYSVLKIENPQIQIVNNKIRYSFRVMAPSFLSSLSQNVACDLDLQVNNGNLAFANAKVNNVGGFPPEAILAMVNKMNPFKIDLNPALGIPSFLQIKDVNIVNNQINLSGIFVAPKNAQ